MQSEEPNLLFFKKGYAKQKAKLCLNKNEIYIKIRQILVSYFNNCIICFAQLFYNFIRKVYLDNSHTR